jgi:dihydrofolate reductase
MTLDGYCDHTAITPDEEIHQHYTDLLNTADVILYGRITYQLMEFWKPFVTNPTGEKAMDDFATAIDKISKIVFSNTIKNTNWESAELSNLPLEAKVRELKLSGDSGDKDIFVGSRSLIIQLLKQNLLDELQICVHPVIAGSGLPLFENLHDRHVLDLVHTKTFAGGDVILKYTPVSKDTTNRSTTH